MIDDSWAGVDQERRSGKKQGRNFSGCKLQWKRPVENNEINGVFITMKVNIRRISPDGASEMVGLRGACIFHLLFVHGRSHNSGNPVFEELRCVDSVNSGAGLQGGGLTSLNISFPASMASIGSRLSHSK
jgi:hypothetical protein